MRLLIVGSGNPKGTLAATRCLSRAGWIVNVGTTDTGGLLSWSRATSSVHAVPPVERDLEAFFAATVAAVEATRSELVIPGSDAELLAISHERARIPALVPLSDDEVVRRSVDKLELVRAGLRVGLPAPETVAATSETLERARYPVAVKSRFHWLPEHDADAPSRLEAAVCADRASAAAHADAMERSGGEPLLQEFVEGSPVNVHVVSDQDGSVLDMLQQDSPKLSYPSGAGRRVRSVVVPLDPLLQEGIPALMRELGWFGFAGLSFLRGADGVPRLVDFNGRIPAALEASAGAGPNYMAMWAALATGRQLPRIPPAKIGKRFQNLEADLRRARRERRGGLLRDVAGTLAYAVGAQHTVAKWDDPLVVLRYSARLVQQSRDARRHRLP